MKQFCSTPAKGLDGNVDMKIRCPRKAFANALRIAASLAVSNAEEPACRRVFVQARKDLVLHGADESVSVTVRVPEAHIESPGATIATAKPLTAFLEAQRGRFVDLEIYDGDFSVTAGRNACWFRGFARLVPRKHLVPPTLPKDAGISVGCDDFRDMFGETAFAAAREGSLFKGLLLTGMRVSSQGGCLSLTATDGERLAHSWRKAVGHTNAGFDLVVPQRAVAVVARAPGRANERIRLCVKGSRLLAEFGNVLVSARRLKGRFPDWQQKLSAAGTEAGGIPTQDLLNAVRAAAAFSAQEDKIVSMVVGDNELFVTGGRYAIEAGFTISCRQKGPNAWADLKTGLLLDWLETARGKHVSVRMADSDGAVLFSIGAHTLFAVVPATRVQVRATDESRTERGRR